MKFDKLISGCCVPSLHREGYPFVYAAAFLTLFCALFSFVFGLIFMILTVCCFLFFRDPQRIVPQVPDGVIVSPADGRIVEITECDGMPDVGDDSIYKDMKFKKIGIFLDICNVHVNRMPCSGEVVQRNYIAGRFINATMNKADAYNERNMLVIKDNSGDIIGVTQIAGLIARRIVCDIDVHSSMRVGERFGIIRFGSRVNVYCPANYDVNVAVGQSVVGGETLIAFDNCESIRGLEYKRI